MSTQEFTPVIDAVCSGDPYQMGFCQGQALAHKIRPTDFLPKLEAFRLQQPRWLPFWLYKSIAEHKASRFLDRGLAVSMPQMRDRMRGIAEGAGVTLRSVYLLNALEPLLSSVAGCTSCPSACSTVAVRGSRSVNGEPMVARNFDYLPMVRPFYALREARAAGGRKALEFTTAPMAGAVDGLNEAGLCIVFDYAFTTDDPPSPEPPISMRISEALEHCSTVEEAVQWITSRTRWGGGLLMLTDATGDMASLELSSTRSFVRRAAAGEDVLFHTNALSSSHMQPIQAPMGSVYTDAAPQALRGRRLHDSANKRDLRFKELLSSNDVLGPDDLGRIMADHGVGGEGGEFTPCVHSDYWNTTACLQFYPKSRRMRVAYDSACKAVFREFQV